MLTSVYKKRVILFSVFLIISLLLAIPLQNSLIKSNNSVKDAINFVESNDDEKVKEETNMNKEDALESLKKIDEYYSFVENNSAMVLYIGLAYGLFGIFSGFIIYFIVTGLILKKFLPDLKSWMTWLLRILVLIILFTTIYLPISLMGMVLCIPYFVYNTYKYIKEKREENKDDIIKE